MERTIENLEQELKTEHDLHLRALADFENYRRRINREREQIGKEALGEFLSSLLDVVDDLERLLEFVGDETSPVIDPVRAVYRKTMNLLTREGVRPLEAVGKPFDPALHEVVGTAPAGENNVDTIVEEVRRGYTWKGDVLRTAQVVVAANPVKK
jgi:molecular chaperone GrpE